MHAKAAAIERKRRAKKTSTERTLENIAAKSIHRETKALTAAEAEAQREKYLVGNPLPSARME